MASQPDANGLTLLPWPVAVDRGAGAITLAGGRLDPVFNGVFTERLERAVARLGEDVRARTGLDDSDGISIRVDCGQRAGPVPDVEEDESYWLVIDDAGVFIDAASEWGVLRGLTTLGQLVSAAGVLPHVAIDDAPRFAWRGLLLDPARHFLPVEALERTLDGMALCKLNVLHLHLSDDQGFRFPVPAYPDLASAEAYSGADLERVVARAADLGIRVVPEIDMPGHVTSWLVAHPEWGARQVAASHRFGVHPACLDPSSEAVYQAVAAVLDALCDVFPDRCIHIGGDEVSPAWWTDDRNVAELMARESLSSLQDVQNYFNKRVGALVEARGRTAIGWDEVLHPQLPESVIVQAWRGCSARDRALARGNPVVVSAPYYLDLNYPVDMHYRFDPGGAGAEQRALEDALLADPRLHAVADGLRWTLRWRDAAPAPSERPVAGVLGAEACLWGELVTEAVLDVRLWSRLPALAERFWSSAVVADLEDLYRRFDAYLDTLHPLRGRDLDAWTVEQLGALGVRDEWLELALMLEPVKWYGRLLGEDALRARIRGEEMPLARPYDLDSALDSLVDHLPPESRRARQLAALCPVAEEEDGTPLLRAAERWIALSRAAADAPAGLGAHAQRLAELGELIRNRLAGERATPAQLLEVGAPLGELQVALPPALCGWLTGP